MSRKSSATTRRAPKKTQTAGYSVLDLNIEQILMIAFALLINRFLMLFVSNALERNGSIVMARAAYYAGNVSMILAFILLFIVFWPLVAIAVMALVMAFSR